ANAKNLAAELESNPEKYQSRVSRQKDGISPQRLRAEVSDMAWGIVRSSEKPEAVEGLNDERMRYARQRLDDICRTFFGMSLTDFESAEKTTETPDEQTMLTKCRLVFPDVEPQSEESRRIEPREKIYLKILHIADKLLRLSIAAGYIGTQIVGEFLSKITRFLKMDLSMGQKWTPSPAFHRQEPGVTPPKIGTYQRHILEINRIDGVDELRSHGPVYLQTGVYDRYDPSKDGFVLIGSGGKPKYEKLSPLDPIRKDVTHMDYAIKARGNAITVFVRNIDLETVVKNGRFLTLPKPVFERPSVRAVPLKVFSPSEGPLPIYHDPHGNYATLLSKDSLRAAGEDYVSEFLTYEITYAVWDEEAEPDFRRRFGHFLERTEPALRETRIVPRVDEAAAAYDYDFPRELKEHINFLVSIGFHSTRDLVHHLVSYLKNTLWYPDGYLDRILIALSRGELGPEKTAHSKVANCSDANGLLYVLLAKLGIPAVMISGFKPGEKLEIDQKVRRPYFLDEKGDIADLRWAIYENEKKYVHVAGADLHETETKVFSNDAHAFVMYFDPDLDDWVAADATPKKRDFSRAQYLLNGGDKNTIPSAARTKEPKYDFYAVVPELTQKHELMERSEMEKMEKRLNDLLRFIRQFSVPFNFDVFFLDMGHEKCITDIDDMAGVFHRLPIGVIEHSPSGAHAIDNEMHYVAAAKKFAVLYGFIERLYETMYGQLVETYSPLLEAINRFVEREYADRRIDGLQCVKLKREIFEKVKKTWGLNFLIPFVEGCTYLPARDVFMYYDNELTAEKLAGMFYELTDNWTVQISGVIAEATSRVKKLRFTTEEALWQELSVRDDSEIPPFVTSPRHKAVFDLLSRRTDVARVMIDLDPDDKRISTAGLELIDPSTGKPFFVLFKESPLKK
ncbi:MAG: transglutaminase domain-containing protein, partial [Patescibacteria group bacterium]